MNLKEVQTRVRRIAHWFDVETEIPVLHKHVSQLKSGEIYLEVGTGLGCTAITAALSSHSAVQIWTIDIGTQYIARLGTLEAYIKAVLNWFEEYGVTDKITFLCRDANQVVWSQPIHCLLIDGDHSYESVKEDIRRWTPHVVKGGRVLFHDYHCIHAPGVKQAVDELMTDGWREAEGGGSIKAFRRR